MLFAPHCPRCQNPLFGKGKLGESSTCECGKMISSELSDRVRRYWAFQVALPYGAATFLLSFVIFHANLPTDRWARLFTPTLIAPAIATFVVVRRVLIRRMRLSNVCAWLFRTYWMGLLLAGLCLVFAVIVEKL